MPGEELERLEIQIDADASGVAPASRKASASMKSMQSSIEKSMAGARKSIESVQASIQGMTAAQRAAMSSVTPKKRASTDAVAAQADEIYAKLSEAQKETAAAQKQWTQAVKQSGSAGFSSPAVMAAESRLNAARQNEKALKKMADDISEKLLKASEGEQYTPLAEGAKKAAESVAQLATAETQAAREAMGAKKRIGSVNEELEKTDKAAVKARRSTQNIFGSIGSSLRSMLIISSVTQLVRSMITSMWSAAKGNAQFATSLGQIKGNLLTAFAPIYSAVLPWINALANALVRATAALATFMSYLFGMSIKNSQKVAEGFGNIGAAASGAGGSAKKALAAFDELNTLDTGGGGGGGGGVTGGIGAIYDEIEASDELNSKMKDILQVVVSIGGAIAAWKIASHFTTGLTGVGSSMKVIAGSAAAIWGTIEAVVNLVDMWKDGITAINSNDAFQGILTAALGLSLAISPIAGAITAIVGGVALLIPSIKELISGEASLDTLANLLRGLGLALAGIGAATGNVPMLIAGGIAAGLSYIVEHWEEITTWWNEKWSWINGKIDELVKWFDSGIKLIRVKAVKLWLKIRSTFQGVSDWFNDHVIKPVGDFFAGLWEGVSQTAIDAWDKVKGVFVGLKNWFNEHVVKPILEAMPQWMKDMLGIDGGTLEAKIGVEFEKELLPHEAYEIEQQIAELNGQKVEIPVYTHTENALRDWRDIQKELNAGTKTRTIPLKIDASITESGKKVIAQIKDVIGDASTTLFNLKSKFSPVAHYASGGMNIDRGQLFVANEAGAELVGTIGGKTAVANQQEIGSAIFRYMDAYGAQRGGGISEQAIANAVARALDGAAVKVGEDKLGELTIRAINKYQRNAGEMLLEL